MLSWILWACALATAALGAEYKVGQKFQIILSSVVVVPANPATKIKPVDAVVFDVDAFETDASTIAALQTQGHIVICYFSAGTYEPYRSDSGSFLASDKGHNLPQWPDEYWLKVTSPNVRKIMTARIQMAASKGCDGVDPDNTDGYSNPEANTTVTQPEAVNYVKFLAGIAKGLNMTIGLKNSMAILPSVSDVMTFAVNEECSHFSECYFYKDFLAAGKPVYQIEYPTPFYPPDAATRASACAVNSIQPSGLSVVFKNLTLDGYSAYCDGSTDYTDTKAGGVPPKPPRTTTVRPHPPTSTSSRTRPTSSKTSTTRPTTSKSSTSYTHTTTTTYSHSTTTTTSTRASSPTSGPTGNPGGCVQKKWDQCGGQDWKGCKTCPSGTTCKYSNPYYSQCL